MGRKLLQVEVGHFEKIENLKTADGHVLLTLRFFFRFSRPAILSIKGSVVRGQWSGARGQEQGSMVRDEWPGFRGEVPGVRGQRSGGRLRAQASGVRS